MGGGDCYKGRFSSRGCSRFYSESLGEIGLRRGIRKQNTSVELETLIQFISFPFVEPFFQLE